MKLQIKDNVVISDFLNQDKIYKQPQGTPCGFLPPEVIYFHKTAAERSGKKSMWKVFPDNHPPLEIVHLDNQIKICWCLLERGRHPVSYIIVSTDGGNDWNHFKDLMDMRWTNPVGKDLLVRACNKLKEEFDKQTNLRLKKEEKERIKNLADVEGITVTELRKRMVEARRQIRLKKLEKQESFADVNEMKMRLEMATALKKMEANLEFLLGLSKQEDSLNVTRLYQKVKTLKTMSSDLDRFVKKFNKERKTK